MKQSEQKCLLCGQVAVTDHSFGMLRCDSCHFFFLSPDERRKQQDTFHQTSTQAIDEDTLESVKKKYPKDSARKHAMYAEYADRAVEWYGTGLHALDIGSSGGFFLRELEKKGVEASHLETCEVDPIFVQLADEYYGYKGGVGNIETYNPGRKYDFLTMFDVLEHVDDFWGALANMHSLLNNDGRLLLKLPNGRWAYLKYRIARFFGKMDKAKLYLHICPGGHLNYWDVNTINLIAKDLYEIESFEYPKPTRAQFPKTYISRLISYTVDHLFKFHLFPEMIVILKKR